MSWLGVLLLGFALTDLAHSVRPARWVPECTGAAAAVVVALLAGMTSGRDLVAILVIVLLVLAWGRSVTRGFGRGPEWLPLVVLVFALVLGIGTSEAAPEAGGVLASWLDGVSLPVLEDLDPDRFLLAAGAFALQLSSGNVIVRLVLRATGTVNPAADGSMPVQPLKGGRLLGPLERVFILGLGLAGQLTAASIVVAAKGLLRFPELSSPRESSRIHQLTEYFLVGSFVSWLVALGSLVLLS